MFFNWRDRNPLLYYLLVQAVLGVVAVFGFDLSGDQIVQILALTNVVISIIFNAPVVPIDVHEAEVREALYTHAPEDE